MPINISIDTGEIGRLATKLGRIDRRLRAKALGRGLNKVAKSGKVVAVKQITDQYNIQKGQVSKRIEVRPARSNLEARIEARPLRSRTIPAIVFAVERKVKEVKKARKDRTGVALQINRGKAKKYIKHAFIARMPSGYVGVFARATRSTARLHIKELSDMDVYQMLTRRSVLPAVEKRINEQLEKVMVHELQFEIDRALRV